MSVSYTGFISISFNNLVLPKDGYNNQYQAIPFAQQQKGITWTGQSGQPPPDPTLPQSPVLQDYVNSPYYAVAVTLSLDITNGNHTTKHGTIINVQPYDSNGSPNYSCPSGALPLPQPKPNNRCYVSGTGVNMTTPCYYDLTTVYCEQHNAGASDPFTASWSWDQSACIPDSFCMQVINYSKNKGHHSATVTGTWTLNVTVAPSCLAANMNSTLCENNCYPNSVANPTCFSEVLEYCFDGNNYKNSEWCLNYLESSANSNSSQAIKFNNFLQGWCQNKYNMDNDTIGTVLNEPPGEIDQELCACNLQQKFYINFASELSEDFNTTSFGYNERCLYPACANAPKELQITGGCKGPACIQIVDFTNNGSIGAGGVTVEQSANCVTLPPASPSPSPSGGGGGGVSPSPSPSPSRTGLIVIAAAAVLILILLLLLVFIF